MKHKVANFFFHYKYHLIIAGILILLAGSFVYTVVTNQANKAGGDNQPNANLEIMIFGDYPDEAYSLIEAEIKDTFTMFTTSDSIAIDYVYAPTEITSQEDMAARQKNQVRIKESTPDIYIFDVNHFNQFVEGGPFHKLDYLKEQQGTYKYYKRSEEDHEHIYGVDVTDNDLFSDFEFANEEKIAVIREDAANIENAQEFLMQLITKKTDW